MDSKCKSDLLEACKFSLLVIDAVMRLHENFVETVEKVYPGIELLPAMTEPPISSIKQAIANAESEASR